MDTVLHALGASRRRDILRIVRCRERSAGDIHRALGDVTFGAVSQHLGVLERAGLVTARRDGRSRLYRTRPEGLEPLKEWLESMWDEALASLKALAEAEESQGKGRRRAAPAARAGGDAASTTRGERSDDRTGPRPRSHRHDRRPAGDGVPLLHGLRALRRLVGRGLAHRAEAGRGGPHPLPERGRRGRRGRGDHAGRARGLHLRLRERPADPDRGLAGHDHARGDGPGDGRSAAPRAAHRPGARRARPGLALPARGLRQRRGEGGARRGRGARRPLLRDLGRDRPGEAEGRARGGRGARRSPSATPTPAPTGSTT